MTDHATRSPELSPFAGVTARHLVRDVVATFALLVALPMPWDLAARGSDRLDVVLTTVLALLAVLAPYVRRAGVGPDSWDRIATPRARLIGCAPYVLVVLVHLVADAMGTPDGAAAVGAGTVLGLTGALLAIAPTWPPTLPVVAGLVALGAVATPVASLLDDATWSATLVAGLNALLVLGVLWLTAGDWLRGNLVAGIVLLVVGSLVALELVLFAGGDERPWFESLHGQRLGLLLLPVVAACAARSVLDAVPSPGAEPADARAWRWVGVAVRSLDLAVLVAGFVALVALVRVVGEGVAVSLVLRLVVGVLMAAAAWVARRALVKDVHSGHSTAVGLACVLVVLGLVVVVARSGLGTQANVEELLVTFGLPAAVLAVLLVPASVRELVATVPEPVQPEPSYGVADLQEQTWPAAGAEEVVVASVQAPAAENAAEPARPTKAARATEPVRTSEHRPVGRAPMEATQQFEPVREPSGAWQSAGQAAGQSAGLVADARPDSTQVLPPVADVPGSPWSATQALDPATPLADLARIVQDSPHLRPHVASNPSTYPALLDWLGALGDPAVDAALRARR